jgi:hypothetical protein
MRRVGQPADRLLPGLLLFWAGLAAGVAILATPAKFMAPSLSLPVALDVGRETFRAYNAAELVLLFMLLVLGPLSTTRLRWYLSLVVPTAAVVAQRVWLLPALDDRVSAVLAGVELQPSPLHGVYIALEALKVAALLAFGLGQLASQGRRSWWR